MRYQTLASDYDGTLTQDGQVSAATIAALERFLASGRQLLLVTGRELDELLEIFPQVSLFERVVAENGALVYRPEGKEVRILAEPPPRRLVDELRHRRVAPLALGQVILATWQHHEPAVRDAIRKSDLKHQIILNKGSLMVLPPGIDKSTGLAAALGELGMPARVVIGVGDAENDAEFLGMCGYSVAVSNALPALKELVDVVTKGDHGTGVIELIDAVLREEVESLPGPNLPHQGCNQDVLKSL
jgi:hydroxymethylpyrimidine pyrophosphatase-like HAD family hydrolase